MWMILFCKRRYGKMKFISVCMRQSICRTVEFWVTKIYSRKTFFSPNIIMWCGFSWQISFLVLIFFKGGGGELQSSGLVIHLVTTQRCLDMLQIIIIHQLHQRMCLKKWFSCKIEPSPHTEQAVQQFLQQHFTNDKVIRWYFQMARLPWFLLPFHFWL